MLDPYRLPTVGMLRLCPHFEFTPLSSLTPDLPKFRLITHRHDRAFEPASRCCLSFV